MDSGNSGSISSSGDEEYESRTDHHHHHHQPIPSFLNPSLTHFGSSSEPNPATDPSQQLLSHHLFDPSPPSSSNYLHQPTSNPNNTNFFLNLDTTVRSRPPLVRSDHNQHLLQHQPYHLGLINNNNPTPSPSSALPSMPNHHSLVLGSHHHFPGSSPIQLQQPSQPQHLLPGEPGGSSTVAAAGLRSGGSPGQTSAARSSKKRTRASRRAPTTVLTTDTSNFRAMVQEFTGIPAPPFSASSPFSRRFDLFGGGSSGIRSGLDGPLYPNLVRPSAIKPPQSTTPFGGNMASSSSSSTPSSSSPLFSNVMVDATNIATSSSLNYAQSSDQHQGLMMNKQPMRNNMLGMQNQGLNMAFHVSVPNNSLNVASGFGGAKQAQPNLALDHHHHHQHQHLNVGHGYGVGADRGGTTSHTHNQDTSSASPNVWRPEGATGPGDMSCKMNYTAAAAGSNSSEFHGEKGGGLEINVSTRGEGTVDSWIFPSD